MGSGSELFGSWTMNSITRCLALICLAAAGCQDPAQVTAPSDVTVFEAKLVGFSSVPAHECDGRPNGCTRTKVIITNVGDEEGDAICIARMFNAKGRRVNVIDMLIAGNLKPGESSGNVVDYAGRATSGKTKCDAYDPGALREIG
jgi:hypothetical protein